MYMKVGQFHAVPISSSSFSFVTCYGSQKLSFTLYLKPFDDWIWLSLLLVLVTAGTALCALFRKQGLIQLARVPFHTISLIFLNGISVPNLPLEKLSYRLSAGFGMIIGGVVLMQAYIGCKISDLSLPLTRKAFLKGFKDLNPPNCTGDCECLKKYLNRSKESEQEKEKIKAHKNPN